MSRAGRRILPAVAAAAIFGLSAVPEDPDRAPVPVDGRAIRLEFTDIRFLPRNLDDFGRKRAFVVAFTTTTCPLVGRSLPELNRLERLYRDRGVQFLAVDVGPDDTIVDMAAQAVENEVPFPFVKDRDGSCARMLGARRTPEVAVLDAEHRLRYRGRIDDRVRLGGARPEAARRDLMAALEDVLAGRPVAVPETPVDGCLITPPAPPAGDAGARTFTEHVAPLLKAHCQECHRPGGGAPFSLISHRDAASRGAMIAEVVDQRRMPPWFASQRHGVLANAQGLADGERATILDWVRSGMPEGDPSRLPAPLPPAGAWRIGEPDLILRMAADHEIPARGDVRYRYAIFPHLFLRDTWIQAAEILPDNPAVVHHCNLVHAAVGAPFREDVNFITGRVPGGDPLVLDDGVALKIPAGSVLGLQIHYVASGKPERSRLSLGLKFPRGLVRKQLRLAMLAAHKFAIPPFAEAHPLRASRTLDADATGVGLFAHMHLRGKDMTFSARRPKGRAETLLLIPNYSFDWQQSYRWAPGTRRFPKGTVLEALAHFDNSAFNPYNPDPAAVVREGAQTRDEMMYGFLFYTNDDEDLGLAIDPKTGLVRAEPGR